MTSTDPTSGLLDRLAAYHEQVTRLDTRETEHHIALRRDLTDLAAGIRDTLADHAAALAQLSASSRVDAEPGSYSPPPTPTWWNLTADGRREPVVRLRAWVERVYRPGYGHLAAGLGPCWDQHDLCLYALDIMAELWSVLYLQPSRHPGLLTAQAEYQARILPALADQLRAETNRCGHPRSPATVHDQPWNRP